MRVFIYSKKMDYRYEYKSIEKSLKENYQERDEFLLIPIEEINVLVDQGEVNVFYGKNKLNIEEIEKIFLIDLGRISLSTLSYRIYLLKYLERKGISIINSPETILICRNKLATYFLLQKQHLPILPTLSVSNSETIDFFLEFYPQSILKPLLGSLGIGIIRLPKEKDKAIEIIDSYLHLGDVPLLQKYMLKHENCDIRLLITGDHVVAGMKRCAPKNQLVTNIAQGGLPKPIKLTSEMKFLGVSAAKAVKGEIVTVDLIECNKRLYILEVNGFARWTGLQKVTAFDISKKIVNYIMGEE